MLKGVEAEGRHGFWSVGVVGRKTECVGQGAAQGIGERQTGKAAFGVLQELKDWFWRKNAVAAGEVKGEAAVVAIEFREEIRRRQVVRFGGALKLRGFDRF